MRKCVRHNLFIFKKFPLEMETKILEVPSIAVKGCANLPVQSGHKAGHIRLPVIQLQSCLEFIWHLLIPRVAALCLGIC